MSIWAAIQGLGQFLPGVGEGSLLSPGVPFPIGVGIRNVILLGFLGLALWLLREAYRRLPLAYFTYALVGVLLPLSVPATDEPLKSFPRFLLVLFPLWIALALWADERGRMREVLVGCAGGLVVFSALFTTWVQAP